MNETTEQISITESIPNSLIKNDTSTQNNETTEQISITESIPNIEIKNDTTSQNSEQTILNNQISESTKQISITESIPNTQIKNDTSTQNNETTILSNQMNETTEQISITESIINTQINNDTLKITPTQNIEEKEQTILSTQISENAKQILSTELIKSTESILNTQIKNDTIIVVTSTQNIEETILNTQIRESTKQISITESIPNTQIKNDTIKIDTTQTIEEKEQTTLSPHIITEQISSTELITSTYINNDIINNTSTQTIEKNELSTNQISNNIKTESFSKEQTDLKTEYQPTTHYINYITNKIDTTNILSNTPTVPSETIYHSTIVNYNENFTSEISRNIPTTLIDKIQANKTNIEKTDIIEKKTSDIVYTTQKENIETIPHNTTINYIETTNIQIKSTLIEETDIPINDFTSVSLLGFSDFKKFPSYFSFYIYFVSIINTIFSKILTFPVIINYYRNMRMLKQVEVNCTLNSIISSKNYRFLCEVYEDTTNIKSIGIYPDFKFISQNNINLIGISPFAYWFLDNLQLIDEKNDTFLNKTIYILDNSTFTSNDILEFTISGVIEGTQPRFENKNISVTSKLREQKSVRKIDCIINNITFNNYLLNCKTNESLHLDLQSAISFIDDGDILLFNFYNTSDFIIKK